MTDDPGFGDGPLVTGAPQLDQGVDDGVQLLLRRIPRLQQVVVEVDDVDRLDRSVGVGVCGEQGSPGTRKQVHRFFEELDASHLGHAMVREQHGHEVAPQLELPQRVQGLRPRFGTHHAVGVAILAAEVTSYCARHSGVVVDGQKYRFPIGGTRHEDSDGTPLVSAPGRRRVVPARRRTPARRR